MFANKPLMIFAILVLSGAATRAMAQDTSVPDQQQTPGMQGQRGPRGGRGDGPPPLMGKITSLKGNSLELTRQDGTTVTVSLSEKTEFRKDRQPAKISDFKVGDMVFIRGDQNADNTVTATIVSARGANGPGGEGGRGFGSGGGPAQLGELGKDYVAGEIKSVDAPKLTVLRSDNVTQTIELTEDSSLRKGRESITMADIQAGDHVVARGTLQNSVFVPKNVMILSTEQWQRMQEMRKRGVPDAPPQNALPNAPAPQPPSLNQPQ